MIYVVTASHNRKKTTSDFARQLAQQKDVEIKLVLVDDGSTDGTGEAVKEILPDAVVIRGNGNLWWGGALNEAYKWLVKNAIPNSFVMFSNDDVEYSPEYVETGVSILERKEKVLLSGLGYSKESGELIDAPIQWDYKIAEGKKQKSAPWEGNCTSTRSLFFRIADLKTIGGFHPILLPHYASDYEWTIRACRKGFSVIADDRLSYLLDERTTGNRERNKLSWKKIWSKKSNMNPFYRLSFILLSTPFYYWPSAVAKQIRRLGK